MIERWILSKMMRIDTWMNDGGRDHKTLSPLKHPEMLMRASIIATSLLPLLLVFGEKFSGQRGSDPLSVGHHKRLGGQRD